MYNSFTSNELIVFILNQYNHYQLHHLIFHEKNLLENNSQIEIQHCCCCCLNNENQPMKTTLVSCSHFLSFINMSCEIDQDNDGNKTNLHFINLDTHLID
jgi:hypothetical protein